MSLLSKICLICKFIMFCALKLPLYAKNFKSVKKKLAYSLFRAQSVALKILL